MIDKMPDDELVERVAEKVMGWRNVSGAYMEIDPPQRWSGWYASNQQYNDYSQWGQPLIDRNHLQMVIDAMDAKGFYFSLETERQFP